MLKCKPGDEVLIVRNTSGHVCRTSLCGSTYIKVHSLVRVTSHPHLGPCWTYEGPLLKCPRDGTPCVGLSLVPDADLSPIPTKRAGEMARAGSSDD